MSKFIIGFFGSKNNGKTSALNEFIKKIEEISKNNAIDILNSIGDDRLVTILYKGNKLGISTGGDLEEIVEQRLKLLHEEKCDLIITACRTNGGTHTAINQYSNLYKVHYVSCPYLYLVDGEISEEKIAINKAVFLCSYVDDILEEYVL